MGSQRLLGTHKKKTSTQTHKIDFVYVSFTQVISMPLCFIHFRYMFVGFALFQIYTFYTDFDICLHAL